MSADSNTIYDGLPPKGESKHEMPDVLAEGVGEFTRSEILTKPILQQDDDQLLNCAMRMMEDYFNRFYDVLALYEEGGRQRILQWQNGNDGAMREHFNTYQMLYQKIGYLQEKEYHMTSWTLAFLVDGAMTALEIDRDKYINGSLSEPEQEQLTFLVEFGGRCLAYLWDNEYLR